MKNAYNFITQVAYTGQNAGLEGKKLNAFATFIQIRNAGFSVNKGAKAITIFTGYYKKLDDDGQEVTIPTYARVFDIMDTSASEDKKFLAWLENEAVIVNPQD